MMEPVSPTAYTQATSLLPTRSSILVGTELEEYEQDLSKREEQFLLDLTNFYKETQEFEREKCRIAESKSARFNRAYILSMFQKNLKTYEEHLELVSKEAKEIMATQIEIQDPILEEIEAKQNQLEDIKQKIIKITESKSARTYEKMEQKLVKIRDSNTKKKNTLDKLLSEANQRLQNLKSQNQELDEMFEKEMKSLADAEEERVKCQEPLFDVVAMKEIQNKKAQADQLESELKQREDSLSQRKEALAKTKTTTKSTITDLESEIERLKKLIELLTKLTKEGALKEKENQDLSKKIQETETEILRVQHKLELQSDDIRELELQEKQLDDKESLLNQKLEKINKKIEKLNKRKQQNEINEENVVKLQSELDQLRKQNNDIKAKTQEFDAATNDIIKKSQVTNQQIIEISAKMTKEIQGNPMQELENLLTDK